MQNIAMFLKRQSRLKRLHLERSCITHDKLDTLLNAVMESNAAAKTMEELYIQGGKMDNEVAPLIINFIQHAPRLQYIDIRAIGPDPQDFTIQIEEPTDFIGPLLEGESREEFESHKGEITAIKREEDQAELVQKFYEESERKKKLLIFNEG